MLLILEVLARLVGGFQQRIFEPFGYCLNGLANYADFLQLTNFKFS
jgi:hypothetical protein